MGRRGRHVAGNIAALGALKRVLADLDASKSLVDRQHGDLRLRGTIDMLSGLLNRVAFFAQANVLYERCQINHSAVSCLMFDVDNFKWINDCHGHHAGDLVIAAIARILQSSARSSDVACRYGGDEFCLFAPAADAMQAIQMADRVRSRIAGDFSLNIFSDAQITISISAGVATGHVPDDTVEALLGRADAALNCAKRAGRSQVRLADDTTVQDQRVCSTAAAC